MNMYFAFAVFVGSTYFDIVDEFIGDHAVKGVESGVFFDKCGW